MLALAWVVSQILLDYYRRMNEIVIVLEIEFRYGWD